MSKADDKLRKKTMIQILIGTISVILLIVFLSLDFYNPLSFLKSASEGSELSLSNPIGTILGLILAFFFLFSYIFAIIGYFQKRSLFEPKFLRFAYDSLDVANIIPIFMMIFFMIDSLFFSFAVVSGESMETSFYNGDVIVTYHTSVVSDNNVVIIELDDRTLIIKRVVAAGGDYLEVTEDGNIYVNNELIEDSANYFTASFVVVNRYLEDGEYYVLGDNRDVSIDSRVRGVITSNQIIGKVVYIISPSSHFGRVS
ncbi:MAG: signal peptidase I [Bacillales bacterium]|nr:signal peptidase I [Bacillales bacterium]